MPSHSNLAKEEVSAFSQADGTRPIPLEADKPRRRRRRRKRKATLRNRIKKHLPKALVIIGVVLLTAALAYIEAEHVNNKPPDVGGP
jgi:hypothetical protein